MNFILDIHCHTVNSGHAFSTISENAAYAQSIGLTHIGIADHGPGMPGGAHLYSFTNLWILPEYINGVRVLKGVEANIMDENGKLDLPKSILGKMEFVVASMHRGVFPPQNKEVHTQAMIRAMENPNMHILGHPGDPWFDIDVKEVVSAAARTGTIIEINSQSLNPCSHRFQGNEIFMEILAWCKELGVPVLASSDAHYFTYVGDVDRAKELILQAGLTNEQVINTSADNLAAVITRKRGLFA